MQTYIFRATQAAFPILAAITFDARSPAHARLRAALVAYVTLGCREFIDVSTVRVDDGRTVEAPHFSEEFFFPIEDILGALFASSGVSTI
jgi:hypothetical protein